MYIYIARCTVIQNVQTCVLVVMRDHCDWWGGKQWVLVGLRYVITDNGALSVLMQKMKHGVRRMLKLPVGPLDTVELSTQSYTTRKSKARIKKHDV